MKNSFRYHVNNKVSVHNLLTRTLTGAVLVATIIGSMIWNPVAFTVVVYILMVAGLREFTKLTDFHHIQPERFAIYLTGTMIYCCLSFIAFGILSAWYLLFIPLMVMVFFIVELFRNRTNALLNIAFSIFAIVYITIPFSLFIYLMHPAITGNNPHWHLAFSFFIIIWSHDTFAYLTGIGVGRHKLFKNVSPKKTWEGSVGGLVFALLASFALSFFFHELSLWQWLTAALLITLSGTFGDLSESLIKRRFNVKDSGDFFPGHGGVLDRFDAVLFSAPVFLVFLIIIGS